MNKSNLTPMMRQYYEMKEQYPDCILFYRLGDFYEMFFEDALVASKELEISLTKRECGLEEKAPMCGVPYHAVDSYLNRLVQRGYKVAICEQMEDASQKKGIVRREVVQIVTAGTNLNMESLAAEKNNYICAILQGTEGYGFAYTDITTGDFRAAIFPKAEEVLDEIIKISASEVVLPASIAKLPIFQKWTININLCLSIEEDDFFQKRDCLEIARRQFPLYRESQPLILTVAGALLRYLKATQKKEGLIRELEIYQPLDYMFLDRATCRNLELMETMREKEKKGSLLWVLDKTRTAMGARKLRYFLERPLRDISAIEERLDAVENLLRHPLVLEEIRIALDRIYDLERLMSKVIARSAGPRDLLALRNSLEAVPEIQVLLRQLSVFFEKKNLADMECFDGVRQTITAAIREEAGVSLKEGGFIRTGFDTYVDQYRYDSEESSHLLSQMEQTEREKTGIRNLKIKYNRSFGYSFEVTNSYKNLVPSYFVRKQTTTNSERYITEELVELEERVLHAKEKLQAREEELFAGLLQEFEGLAGGMKELAGQLAVLDVYQSLATAAGKQRYCRPVLKAGGDLFIDSGRHPVVEKMMGDGFVPNSVELNQKHHLWIITGPNMAGKSTFMRQVALIQLMAQIGSFVPAERAILSPADRIFTRVGASDDLASGQSTFMVEMSETANILKNATKDSLVILDEIGRGTSTYDGLSIAWAVVEYLADSKVSGAKTLFATHYHELTELEDRLDGVANYCIAVAEKGEDILFLRTILRGGADKSYGIQVAALAGIPDNVVKRAKEILQDLSAADILNPREISILSSTSEPICENGVQIRLFSDEELLFEEISGLELDDMTPRAAWDYLNQLQERIQNRN